MSDNHGRTADRMRVLRQGKIVWDNASRTINCTIRDMSKTGALIELPAPTSLPDTFELNMPPSKELRPVQVMRRSGISLGIMFLDTAMASENSGDGGGSEARYNPAQGDIPIYTPVSQNVRDMLPWA